MKYLIVKENSCESAILFSELLTHADIAGGLRVLGAGFCQFLNAGEVVCYGESISCGVKSRGKEDEMIIAKELA